MDTELGFFFAKNFNFRRAPENGRGNDNNTPLPEVSTAHSLSPSEISGCSVL